MGANRKRKKLEKEEGKESSRKRDRAGQLGKKIEKGERRRRDGETEEIEIKAEWLIDVQEEGEEEWGMPGGGGDGGNRGEGGGGRGGRENYINEEMSDEQRQALRPLSA